MRTLCVVTHPEATHHVHELVGGWHDSELTHTGLEAAERIGATLAKRVPAGEPVEVFSSDLRRTAQTAEAICRYLAVPPVFDARLREKSYGAAEGRSQAWLDARFRTPLAHGERLRHDEGIDGAETMHQFATRVYDAMDEILARECAHQIISTHGGALTFIAAAFLRLPIDALGHMRLRSVPGGITVLREDDYFHNRILVELNTVP
ncbi:histidine phosphatase family protein [Corynebacterium sp. J010B-136]|uniref:histidine phosphatase family protein n=1 Tax=Corynebacterium sp. J010B-136 TaxID=2099401 RepID=UPI000CF91465|nr:histidine phosphatase family protein [Corynebacterium sp. J010B-136]PQM73955.1 histidine phosphatase family protein [Corynebacterium sp. J010B-136]